MMNDFDHIGDDSINIVFRDVILLALAGFVAIVIILIAHIHPPKAQDSTIKSPGNLIIEITWPPEQNTDIDLWVQAPGDNPVGYSSKDGKIFNLLRDDLGHLNDVSNINYEVAYTRGIVAGEYVVNVHWYNHLSLVDKSTSVNVSVTISIRKPKQTSVNQVFNKTVTLNYINEELTVVRFHLSEDAVIIGSSINDVPIKFLTPLGTR